MERSPKLDVTAVTILEGQLGAITSQHKACCLLNAHMAPRGKPYFCKRQLEERLEQFLSCWILIYPLLHAFISFRASRATEPLLHMCQHGYKTCLQHTKEAAAQASALTILKIASFPHSVSSDLRGSVPMQTLALSTNKGRK